MPRMSQIIPEYLVPHVKTYINDNSMFTNEVATPSEDGVRLLCVFASAKGEDGVIKTITNVNDYIDQFGTPNYNLYGQPCYMPYAALSSGNAKCYCMRVMPTTAAYANIMISAYAKVVENAEDGSNNFSVKFVAEHVDNLTDKDSMLLQLQDREVVSPETTDDGYQVYPLFAVNAIGRGEYGNAYHIRLVSDSVMNTDNEFMNYIFELLDSSGSTLVMKERHNGCFTPDAIVDNSSLLIDDVCGDPDSGSTRIMIHTNYNAFTKLYEAYSAFVTANMVDAVVPNINNCDFFTGLAKDRSIMPGYVLDIEAADHVALDSTLGITMGGGDDSTFAANAENRQQAMDEAYIAAFNGDFDISIRSKRPIPCELILDANYSTDVKMKLAELALHRYDARCVIDAGILSTTDAAVRWASSTAIKAIADAVISKECQHYKIRDPFTGRAIPVTATYFIAENLPTHYKTFGNHIPFVGEGYAQLTNHIRGTVKPDIDADNTAVKEALYTNHCNFFECIAENNYVRGVQSTSQNAWTDLSEENNMAVVLEMKRMLEEFIGARLYNFAEAEDRIRFTEDANRMFSEFRGSKVSSYEVYFDMNEFEQQRSILHCYLAVVFRTIAKRGIIEIDINKRS